MKSGTTISLEARRQYESLLAPFFAISEEVEIPAGDYTFYDIGLYYGITPGRLLRTDISLAAGSFFDGNRMTLQVSPTWNQSRYFELGAEYEFWRWPAISGSPSGARRQHPSAKNPGGAKRSIVRASFAPIQ